MSNQEAPEVVRPAGAFCCLVSRWLVLAAQPVLDILEGLVDKDRSNIENDAQDDRSRPDIHPVLDLQFFVLDVHPAPNVGIEHADQAQDAFQRAFLLEELDQHHDTADKSDERTNCSEHKIFSLGE